MSTHVHGLHRYCILLLAVVTVQNAAAGSDVRDAVGDLAQTLHRLGFDPHHRQFITKLHEKGMLSFLSDKDLSAVGMSEEQIRAYRSLATDLGSGNTMHKDIDKSETSAKANTGTNGKTVGPVDTDAVSDDKIEMSRRIKTLEKSKRCVPMHSFKKIPSNRSLFIICSKAAADEDYMEAARLQTEIGKLKDRIARKQNKNPEWARLQKRIEEAVSSPLHCFALKYCSETFDA